MKIDEIVDQIDSTTEKFNKTVDIAQSRLLREVLALTKDLATKDGRIMPTVENLKTINAIRNKISKIVVNKDYANAVKDLMKSFETVQDSQIDYFRSQFAGGKLSQKYDLVRQLAIENTAQQLTQSGLDANVTSGIKNMLVRSVVSGGQYSDLVGQLNEYLTDTDKGSGALTKYAKTYASTSLSQLAGETNKLLVQDFAPKWFRYVGSNKETTREWCEHMTAKEWVHISEFDELVRGDIDGKKVEIYERTGLPKGMIDGTDAENLIINRGGWGCQHQFYAVDERIVPENIKAKFNGIENAAKTTDFKPAKTMEEALQILKSFGVKEMNISGITIENANLILKTLSEFNNIGINQFSVRDLGGTVGGRFTSISEMGVKRLEINSRVFKENQYQKTSTYEEKLLTAKNNISILNQSIETKKAMLGQSAYKDKIYKADIKRNISQVREWEIRTKTIQQSIDRKEVLLSQTIASSIKDVSTQVKATIYHEMGHAFDSKYGFTSGKKWNTSRTEKLFSEYANTTSEEMFAEGFTKYKIFGESGIPKDLLDIYKTLK